MKLKDIFTKKEKEHKNSNNKNNQKIGRKKGNKTEIRTYLDEPTINWLYNYSKNNNTKISRTIREILETYRNIIENKV